MHVTGVVPADRVDRPGLDQALDLSRDSHRGLAAVDQHQVDVPAQYTAGGIDLVRGEQRRVERGGADHAEGAGLRDDEADSKAALATRQNLGLQRVGKARLECHPHEYAPVTPPEERDGRTVNETGTRTLPEPALVELLTIAQRRVARQAATALAEEGFTVDQWRLLRALADGDGHSMGELADRLAIPAASLTRLTEGLVDLGLVYRRQADDDRRRTSAHLSRQGQARLERLNALVEAAEAALRRSPEWDALSRVLRQVHRVA